ncbi:MAG TPA: hypothetical protein VKA95_12055 [Nitrososphaeraceae archaeon]|nr:hypothetical protein [Nitrososphaeraceae archaeon]
MLSGGLAKFNKEQSLSIGSRINEWGMVELVILFVGFSAGFLDLNEPFSIVHA